MVICYVRLPCHLLLLAARTAKGCQRPASPRASARLGLLNLINLWIDLGQTECISEGRRASLDTAPEHADPSPDWICFIKLNNKSLRGLDVNGLASSFPPESDRGAPYGAIPYCIMQCCNRLRLCAGLQGGVLGRLRWLTSLSLPPSERSACPEVNFLLPRFSTDRGRHEQRGNVNIHATTPHF